MPRIESHYWNVSCISVFPVYQHCYHAKWASHSRWHGSLAVWVRSRQRQSQTSGTNAVSVEEEKGVIEQLDGTGN